LSRQGRKKERRKGKEIIAKQSKATEERKQRKERETEGVVRQYFPLGQDVTKIALKVVNE